MARLRTKIGDIFAVDIDADRRKYFQYVADDLTQLNSQVIRAFKKSYSKDESPDLTHVVAGEIDFYAHVFLRIGFKLGCWSKVGNVSDVGKLDMTFRGSHDSGNPGIKISENWYTWKINGAWTEVGTLEGNNRNAEIGVVVAPPDIVHRMQTGKYLFLYPGF